jgi:hypothetical protein
MVTSVTPRNGSLEHSECMSAEPPGVPSYRAPMEFVLQVLARRISHWTHRKS